MSRFKKADDPDQALLLPQSPRDWLPQGHLAWFVMETVDQLNIDGFLDFYRQCGKGELPYPPKVMLALLIYAYATGVKSSRRIAAQIEDSIAFRVMARGFKPNHRTICRFREDHLDEFVKLFAQVAQIAAEAGMVKLGLVAVDGTKIKANASKHKAMSYDRMLTEEKRLREEIEKLTQAAKNQDEIDDKSFGPDFRGDELPAELSRRETRLKTILEAKQRLIDRKTAEAEAKRAAEAAAQGKHPEPPSTEPVVPEPRNQENFTDPDSRIMPTAGKSFDQCYNAQVAVDAENQIIVSASVVQAPNDNGQLLPVLNQVFECTGKVVAGVIADAGYKNERDLAQLAAMNVDAFIATGREGKNASSAKAKGPHTIAMNEKLATESGRETYAKRKWIVEPPFGWIKHVLGFRAFSLRGLRKVGAEWNLVCLALNLRRMAAIARAM
jgi:transposase